MDVLLARSKTPQELLVLLTDNIHHVKAEINQVKLDSGYFDLTQTLYSLEHQLSALEESIKTVVPSKDLLAKIRTLSNEYDKSTQKLHKYQSEIASLEKQIKIEQRAKEKEKTLDKWDKNRAHILESTRKILKSEYHSSVPIEHLTHKIDTITANQQQYIFQFAKCHVTSVTEQFSRFLYEILTTQTFQLEQNDSEQDSEEDKHQSIVENMQTIILMIELFINIVPVFHARYLQVPRVAALFYNDTHYLEYQISLIPILFPFSKLKNDAVLHPFNGLGLNLAQLGNDTFDEHLTSQISQIIETIQREGGLGSTHLEARKDEVLVIFNQIQHEIAQLCKSWREVLPAEKFLTSLGSVINHIFAELIDQAQSQSDFGQDECKLLNEQFSSLLSFRNEFYSESGEAVRSASHYVELWKKYSLVCALFELPMVTITEMWERGELSVFSAAEIRKWITALFSATSFREKNLSKIN